MTSASAEIDGAGGHERVGDGRPDDVDARLLVAEPDGDGDRVAHDDGHAVGDFDVRTGREHVAL